MNLFDELTRISRRVESQLQLMMNNEDATIAVSVLPFIHALGYDTQDLSEVYPQYAILNMDAVDRAILRDGEPIMFLEAKNAGEKLSTKHWKQLFQYFNADKAHIGILTNGIEYRFYTDTDKKHIMDKEAFLVINLLDLDKVSVSHLEGFTKARFDPETSLRNLKLRTLVEQELRQPSDDFVKHFAKQVHDGSMWKEVIAEYRPIVKKYFHEALGNSEDGDKSGPAAQLTTVDVKDDPPIDSEDKDDETLVFPNISIPLRKTYLGQLCEATLVHLNVSEEGYWEAKIKFDGQEYTPSGAAKVVAKRINPKLRDTNGWAFWRVIDPEGYRERPIGDLGRDRDLLRRVMGNYHTG